MTFDKKKYDQAYAKSNYDRIPLNVKKGDKALIAEHAKKKGFESVTDYIKHLIYRDMEENKTNTKNITIGEINQNGDNNNINIR